MKYIKTSGAAHAASAFQIGFKGARKKIEVDTIPTTSFAQCTNGKGKIEREI